MKKCFMCEVEKPEDDFAWRVKGKRRQSHCKQCQAEYRKAHHEANRSKYLEKAKKNREKIKKEFYEMLSKQSCLDCGVSDPRVLEFDHVRGEKEFNISTGVTSVSKARLEAEMEKCDIVCANCHRIRTATRGNWYSYAT